MFVKGISGNPSGKKKKTDAQKLFENRCTTFMNTKGWKLLQGMADGEDKQDRRFAIENIMHYGMGKPSQAIDVSHFDGEDPATDAEIVNEIEQLIGGATGAIEGPISSIALPEGKRED